MNRTEPLLAFARGLHQDVLVESGDATSLAQNLLSYLTSAERDAFRYWLADALQKLTPAEMKGLLNGASSDLRFSSEGAHRLFRAAAKQLG